MMSNSSMSLPGAPSRPTERLALRKLRAAAIHAACSAIVVGVLGAVMVALWYPWPLFLAAGAPVLLGLVAFCDVVMGPALTFVVFRPGKPSLRFDLATIALLQLAALGYGVASVYQARPVFALFVVDRFELVAAPEIDAALLERAPEALRVLSRSGPVIAAARLPTDPQERERLLMTSAAGGADLRAMPQHYVPYEEMRDAVIARARPVHELARRNDRERVERIVARHGGADSVRWLPLSGRAADLAVFVDARSARVLGIERLRPW